MACKPKMYTIDNLPSSACSLFIFTETRNYRVFSKLKDPFFVIDKPMINI